MGVGRQCSKPEGGRLRLEKSGEPRFERLLLVIWIAMRFRLRAANNAELASVKGGVPVRQIERAAALVVACTTGINFSASLTSLFHFINSEISLYF